MVKRITEKLWIGYVKINMDLLPYNFNTEYSIEEIISRQHLISETTPFSVRLQLVFRDLSTHLNYCFGFLPNIYVWTIVCFEKFAYLLIFKHLCRQQMVIDICKRRPQQTVWCRIVHFCALQYQRVP